MRSAELNPEGQERRTKDPEHGWLWEEVMLIGKRVEKTSQSAGPEREKPISLIRGAVEVAGQTRPGQGRGF